jgi:hypothetical protein
VFWLSHPPYLRWILAAALIVGALAWEFQQAATVRYPFAQRAIASGEPIPEDTVDWRPVPQGLMELPDLSAPIAARDLAAGEPIGPSAVAAKTVIPDEWWSVPIALPAAALPGRPVRLVLLDLQETVDGVVVAAARPDPLSLSDAGLVAVPGEHAPAVAMAAVAGTIAVLVQP